MCLGIPGRVDQWLDRDPLMASARINFDGVFKVCHMACVPEADVGDYVLVHAGIALAVLDEVEAIRLIASLTALGEVDRSKDLPV